MLWNSSTTTQQHHLHQWLSQVNHVPVKVRIARIVLNLLSDILMNTWYMSIVSLNYISPAILSRTVRSPHNIFNTFNVEFILGYLNSCFHFQLFLDRVIHDVVIKWKYFPLRWPFVRGIHRSPVNSPYKGQWRGTFDVFSSVPEPTVEWTGDLWRHRSHYDDIVMTPVGIFRFAKRDLIDTEYSVISNILLSAWKVLLFFKIRTIYIPYVTYRGDVESFCIKI